MELKFATTVNLKLKFQGFFELSKKKNLQIQIMLRGWAVIKNYLRYNYQRILALGPLERDD